MDTKRKLRVVFTLISLASFVLVALGAFVRGTGAGLSCPDWPLCLNQVVPSLDHFLLRHGLTQEYLHRILAAFVGCLTIAACVMSFRSPPREAPQLFRWSIALLALVVVQGVFGGLTVLLRLEAWVVTTHLALGTVFLQACGWIAWSLGREKSGPEIPVWIGRLAWVGAVLLFVQMLLGGFVASTVSGLACGRALVCKAALSGGIQPLLISLHVIFGTALLVVSLGVALVAFRSRASAPFASKTSNHVFSLLALQAVLGVLVVYFWMPALLSAMHLVIAQLLLFRFVTLCAVPRVATST